MSTVVTITIADADLPRVQAWAASVGGAANAKQLLLNWLIQQVQLYEQNAASRNYANTYVAIAPV